MKTKQKNQFSRLVIMLICFSLFSCCIVTNVNADDPPITKWIKTFASNRLDKAYDITTDSNDNIIVTGESKIDGDEKSYTIKYNPNGNQILTIISNTTYESKSYGISIDSEDNIILTGSIYNDNGDSDYYTVKYNPVGEEQWSKYFDSGGEDVAYGVAVDSDDNIIITGESLEKFYTIKYDKFGNVLWNKTYGTSNIYTARSIAVDSFNNIVVTGNGYTASSKDWHTVKYSPSGVQIWNKILTNGAYNSANGVTVDSQNNIIVTGKVFMGVDSDIYLIKYDENGNEIWKKAYDNSMSESGEDVTINSFDEIYIVGSSFQTLEGLNYIILKFDSEGNYKWAILYDRDNQDDYGFGIKTDTLNYVIVTGACYSSSTEYDYVTIKLGEKPKSDFVYNPANPFVNDNINFIDKSADLGGSLVSWSWNFGDGSTSSLQNPKHQYSDNGEYLVTLTVIDDDGLTDTISKNLTVYNAAPHPDFSYAPSISTPYQIIQFNDLSNDPDGSIISRLWDFDDGNTSNQANIEHFYTYAGLYNVVLNVTDDDGASETISKELIVNIIPLADFTYAPIEPFTNQQITFNDLSVDSFGPIVSWNWDFGDGKTSDKQNPTHSYDDDGKYIVYLEVTDQYGFTNATSQEIEVYNVKPSANFIYTPTNPTDLQLVIFTEGSTDSDGTLVSWNWSFGDGFYSNIQNPTHLYTEDGTYTVLLHILDDDGAEDTFSKQIQIFNEPPIADFDYKRIDGTYGTFQFNYSSYDTDGAITNWTWDFDDGNISYIKNPVHQYSISGDYDVKLTVTDNDGSTDVNTATLSIFIPPRPSKVTGLQVKNAKNGKLNISWNKSDDSEEIILYNVYREGIFLTNATETYYYDIGLTNGKSYIYRISAVNIYGIEGIKSDSVAGTPTAISKSGRDTYSSYNNPSIINKPPVADASSGEPYTGFIYEDITFDGSLSYDPDGNIVNYIWDFGNDIITGEIVNYIYSKPGTYNVTLTVEDDSGNKDSYQTETLILTANIPPTNPIISGPNNGSKNIKYSFIFMSTDDNNDSLIYRINWGDKTTNETNSTISGVNVIQIHAWSKAGRYIIIANASDNKTVSVSSEYEIFIDSIEVFYNGAGFGYLIDEDGDGIYDLFYCYETENATPVKFEESVYYIDINNDQKTDYVYYPKTNEFSKYRTGADNKANELILLIIILLILIYILFLFFLKIVKKLVKNKKRNSNHNILNKKTMHSLKLIFINLKTKVNRIKRKIHIYFLKRKIFNPSKKFFKKQKIDILNYEAYRYKTYKEVISFVDSLPDIDYSMIIDTKKDGNKPSYSKYAKISQFDIK